MIMQVMKGGAKHSPNTPFHEVQHSRSLAKASWPLQVDNISAVLPLLSAALHQHHALRGAGPWPHGHVQQQSSEL